MPSTNVARIRFPHPLSKVLKRAQADVHCLSKELESWKSKYQDLEKEKENLFTDMKEEIENKTMESVQNIKGI